MYGMLSAEVMAEDATRAKYHALNRMASEWGVNRAFNVKVRVVPKSKPFLDGHIVRL
jgi:hypothetical protein